MNLPYKLSLVLPLLLQSRVASAQPVVNTVHLEAESPGFRLERSPGEQSPQPICQLPCDIPVPTLSRLVLRHPNGGYASFAEGAQLRGGDAMRLRYQSRNGLRIAGWVTGGIVVASWITLFAVGASQGFDFTFGTSGSHENPLGFAYGFVIGLSLGPSLALITSSDRVEMSSLVANRPRALALPEGASTPYLQFTTTF